ncbi:MAG TPA: molecular chaperone HtpG [Vicinamibacteria bacterium]|nr:molecular chaperone HtpG [Vicinamibacteria bacterium]
MTAKKTTKKKTKKTGTDPGSETFSFQTEVQKLLDLMVHSLYSHKEIFLRELISNASDALDRLRFESLTNQELLSEGTRLEIRLEADRKERLLTVHDNGIGMTRQEVIDNIGTIAKSGTQELAEKLRKSRSDEALGELIGQFGVGFYSSFMVADKVVVVTRRAGEPSAQRWESSGQGQFSVEPTGRETNGTSVTLHLKAVDEEEGLEDFTDPAVLARIVKRYSDFISYPIVLKAGDEEKTLNSMKPIWERPASEVNAEEYAEFYKHITHDWRDPLETIVQKAEGLLEYKALLFIPSEAPVDLYFVGSESGLKLYVKRVLIMESCEELLPRYLRFLRGVVDSSDLPLNVSREILQQDRQIRQMRKGLLKKVLDALQSMKETDEARYLKFWTAFGRALKEGVPEDFENRDKIVSLCLFASSADSEKLTSLSDYVSRMKEEQDAIYYIAGGPREMLESSPHLEAFRDRGLEVLFMTDAVDELLVQALPEFEGKTLRSAGKGTLELGSEDERKQKKRDLDEKSKGFEELLTRVQKILDDRVKEVRLSNRLTTSPACLVGGEHEFSPRLESWLREQRGDAPVLRRILELNPDHEVVSRLKARFDVDESSELIPEYAELLYGYAVLAEGSPLRDPAAFARRFADLMARGFGP